MSISNGYISYTEAYHLALSLDNNYLCSIKKKAEPDKPDHEFLSDLREGIDFLLCIDGRLFFDFLDGIECCDGRPGPHP